MPVPSPKERPDLYDDFDGRAEVVRPEEKKYWDRIAPDHIKDLLAKKGQPDKPAGTAPAAPKNENPA